MNKKKLFYKAITWNIIGLVMTSIISFLWFGNWIQSLSFSLVLIIISIFTYVLYEIVWNKLSKKMKKIKLAISGCMGRMGQQLIKSSKKKNDFKLVTLTENRIVNKKQKELLEQFRDIENEKSNPSIRKFFEKAKNFWNN